MIFVILAYSEEGKKGIKADILNVGIAFCKCRSDSK